MDLNETTHESLEQQALELAQDAVAAARSGDLRQMRQALDLGVPVELCSASGDSLLMLAAYHGHREVAALLLQRGANPTALSGRGQQPLAGVAFKGDVEMATLLLDHGAPVDGAGPDGRTALMFAALFDQLGVLELLLNRGADPSLRDSGGMAAAELAQHMGAFKAWERLEGLI